ncbi:MAG: SDR family oxidoreductase [Planctomycetota bacterium]
MTTELREQSSTEAASVFGLEGRTVVVTGAGGLLGSEFCRLLATLGAEVWAIDLTEPEERDRVTPLALDVTREDELRDARSRIGGVDGLVNSAAIDAKFDAGAAGRHTVRPEDFPVDLWERSLSVNVTGTFLACRVFGEHMAERGRGSIVNIGSTYGLVAPDQRLYDAGDGSPPGLKPPDYAVTKAAVIHLTRYLAVYWGGRGVRVNTLTPGGVRNTQDPGFVSRYATRTPLGRMAERHEIAAPLAFLLSDASSYMTGSNLVVDGGWTAW